MEIVAIVQLQAPQNYKSLFPPKSPEAARISLKETTKEDYAQISELIVTLGLPKITSILQPSGSAEINSQNFIVTFDSNENLLLRRCRKFQGRPRYQSLYDLLEFLKKEGVRVPECHPLACQEGVPYFETTDLQQKVSGVFFKYIEAEHYFSGNVEELVDAAEQIGKMHACLTRQYGQSPILADQSQSQLGPFMTLSECDKYFGIVQQRIESGGDEYDRQFMENRKLIRDMAEFVEANAPKPQQHHDIQNIHFDLNSANFLATKDHQITIMDFDEVRLGNVYVDIGFALHRLVTTCVEQGRPEQEIPELIKSFLASYAKYNPDLKFDIMKLILAMYNRALLNIKNNLVLKYDKNSPDWLTSIPVNIQRLKQVIFLTEKLASSPDKQAPQEKV